MTGPGTIARRPRRAVTIAAAVMVLVLGTVGCSSDPGEPESSVQPEATAEALGRIRVDYGDEPDNYGWLQFPDTGQPDDGHPVVVLVHGGFWRQGFDLSLMEPLAEDLADRGYATWNIEFRRVGGDGGWPQTGDDVALAIAALPTLAEQYSLDLERVVSVGHSAGGHLALWALGQEDGVTMQRSIGLGAIVDLAYFGESVGLLGGSVSDAPGVYDDAAPVLDPERVVLVQGLADGIVPSASLQPAVDAGVTVVEIDGDDHFDLIDPSSASWAATVELIDRVIGS